MAAPPRSGIEVDWSSLPLTGPAIEGRAAALHDALDVAAAAGRRAGLAFAVVDREGMLEIAQRAVGLHIVAQRRSAGGDRIGDDRTDRLGQAFALSRWPSCRPWRSCPPRAAATGRRATAPPTHRYCQVRRSASGRAAPPSTAICGPSSSEASRAPSSALPVGSTPSPASIGCVSAVPSANSMKPKRRGSLKITRERAPSGGDDMEHDMVVRGVSSNARDGTRPAISLPSAVSMRNEPDMPRWQISTGPPSICMVRYLARRPSAVMVLPVSRCAKSSRKRKPEIGPARLDADDAGAFQNRLQAAPDRFDLGQFRHGRLSSHRRKCRDGRAPARDVRRRFRRYRRRSF